MNKSVLINLHRIMVFIRFDIKNKRNNDILCILIQSFDGLIDNKDMCDAIVRIMPDWKVQLIREELEDLFIHEKIIEFVKKAMEIARDNLNTNEFDIAYDIADILHVLPDIVIQNDKKGLKKYWKVYIERFNKKWKCDALARFKRYFMKCQICM